MNSFFKTDKVNTFLDKTIFILNTCVVMAEIYLFIKEKCKKNKDNL